MLNIIDIDDSPVELSTECIDAVCEVLEDIKTSNTVSRNQILGLEEFLGVQIITKTVNKNKLTRLRTPTMCEETKEILEEVIKSSNRVDITIHSCLTLTHTVMHKVKELIHIIEAINSDHNIDTLDRLINEKYVLMYNDAILIDKSKEELISSIKYGSYVSEALTENKYDNLYNYFQDKEVSLFTGLCILSDRNALENIYYVPKLKEPMVMSFNKVVSTVQEGYVLPMLTSLLSKLKETLSDIKDYTYDNDDINVTFKRLTAIRDTLLDDDSLVLLRNIIK